MSSTQANEEIYAFTLHLAFLHIISRLKRNIAKWLLANVLF